MSLLRRKRSSDEPGADEPRGGGLRERLQRTREAFSRGLEGVFQERAELGEAFFEELEDTLISADVGVNAAANIVDAVRLAATERRIRDAAEVRDVVRRQMARILEPCEAPLAVDPSRRPWVIMTIGVNGVGKTTTVAKLAHRLQGQGHSVMLAAADTFRAAAIEQLQSWGERLKVPVIAQSHGADAAAVAHDALSAARARGADVLIVDTAGRQHTQRDLMEQLVKVNRVLERLDPGAPHEVLAVLDAGTGQNALSQLEKFSAVVNVSGLALTKLDGTARGGIALAIARRFALPIRYIGVGEGLEDLREFHARDFVEALLPEP